MAKTKAGINAKTTSLRGLLPTAKQKVDIDSFGPAAGPLRVIRINIDQRDFLKQEFKKAGIPLRSEDLRSKLSKRSAMLLNELSRSALDAVKSKIPVGYRNKRSGKLRSQVQITGSGAGRLRSFTVGTGTVKLTREVIVESGPHSPINYKGFTGKGSSLAAFLDQTPLNRTRPSEAQGEFKGVARGSSTAWSGKAIDEFRSKKSQIIQSIIRKI